MLGDVTIEYLATCRLSTWWRDGRVLGDVPIEYLVA